MALFKILRGNSANLSNAQFHDGYAYFTHDDGGFYIDSEVGGEQKRTQINKKSSAVSASLAADGWNDNKQQTVAVAGLGADQNGIVSMSPNLTAEQYDAVVAAKIYLSAQSAGSLTFTCRGEVPTVNIPVSIILLA